MQYPLEFDGFTLIGKGPKLTLTLSEGQSLGVLGPAGSGKSHLLQKIITGQGLRAAPAVAAGVIGPPRKANPQSISLKGAGPREPVSAAEVLSLLGLWEVRHQPLQDLTPGQLAACELIGPLLAKEPLLVIDGQLDRLDPLVLHDVVAALKERLAQGACLVVATNRLELAAHFDALIVLRDQKIAFAGAVEDLLRKGPPSELEVETTDQKATRALVEPFNIRIESTEAGLKMWAQEGQKVAARLLLEGYGDVRFVVIRKPSIEQAIRALMAGSN